MLPAQALSLIRLCCPSGHSSQSLGSSRSSNARVVKQNDLIIGLCFRPSAPLLARRSVPCSHGARSNETSTRSSGRSCKTSCLFRTEPSDRRAGDLLVLQHADQSLLF